MALSGCLALRVVNPIFLRKVPIQENPHKINIVSCYRGYDKGYFNSFHAAVLLLLIFSGGIERDQ